MSETADVIVIGGGIVGVAAAASLSRHYGDVFVLESQPRLGMGTTTRNSGVVHAGIYYPKGSLKAVHCVRGNRLLYDYCEQHGVAYQRLGKLIVAQSLDELPRLEALKARGDENGALELQLVDADFIARHEPNVRGAAAIYSPSTGIVEVEELLGALERQAGSNGAFFLKGVKVEGADHVGREVEVNAGGEVVRARAVVNAAGLFADEVARMLGNNSYRIYPCRGEYCELPPSKGDIVRGLVYPLPEASGHGLGVHFTKNVAGTVLLGPNARYIESKDDYEGDRTDPLEFYASAARLVPSLRPEDLRPSYSGIRPKLAPPGQGFADFVIQPDPEHPNVVHAIGIESPGLTAALSIAETVTEMVRQSLD